MKKLICIIVIAVVALLLLASCQRYPMPPPQMFYSLEDMTSNATDVVRAEVLELNARYEEVYRLTTVHGERIYTRLRVHRIEILEVFHGNAQPGDVMEVGDLDWSPFQSPFERFRGLGRNDDDLILFLSPRVDNYLFLVTSYQASYRVPSTFRDESILDMPADTVLPGVFAKNDDWLTLTAGFLQQLTLENYSE